VEGIGSISGEIKISDLKLGGVVVRNIKKLLTLVHCMSRSIFEVLSEVKIFNFSCNEIYDQIIWGII